MKSKSQDKILTRENDRTCQMNSSIGRKHEWAREWNGTKTIRSSKGISSTRNLLFCGKGGVVVENKINHKNLAVFFRNSARLPREHPGEQGPEELQGRGHRELEDPGHREGRRGGQPGVDGLGDQVHRGDCHSREVERRAHHQHAPTRSR